MMNPFKTGALLATLLTAAAASAQTSTWKIETPHSDVEFSIRHLGVSNVHGRIGGVTGQVTWNPSDPSKSHVEATMDTSTVDTGEAKRDVKLKSDTFFNVDKYPRMAFKSTAVRRNGDGKLQIVGDLTLGGQTKPITLDVDGPAAPQPRADGKTMSGFSASGTISREAFQFGQNDATLKPPIIGNEVKFTIDLEVSR